MKATRSFWDLWNDPIAQDRYFRPYDLAARGKGKLFLRRTCDSLVVELAWRNVAVHGFKL
jgi:hypothetical protein